MTIKRPLATCVALLALGVAGCGGDDEEGSAASGATEVEVGIKDFKYLPEAVEVKAGGTVTFANSDKAKHNAQTDADADGAFDTGDLQQGDSKSVTFDQAGTYAYYCIYHRFMTGTVEVSE